MLISIRHSLSIGVGAGVAHAVQHLLLTPLSGATQTVREWTIAMPGFAEAASFTDAFGNRAQLVSQTRPEGEIQIAVAGLVETIDRYGVVGRPAGEPALALFRRVTEQTKPVAGMLAKFRNTAKDGKDRIALFHAVMERVHETLAGEPAQSQTQDGQSQSQSQGQSQGKPAGSAIEHAHAFIGTLRALQLPARFVSGYLAGAGEDAAFHAWAEAWDDGLGWIGFDPTLNVCPTDQHVRVAAGLDAAGTPPVRAVPSVGTPQLLEMRVEAAQ